MSQPTAKQKRWAQWCRNRGCILTGAEPSIHHIKGREYKLKGVDKAGHWYILPVAHNLHKWDSNPFAIHTNRKAFERHFNTTEKRLYIQLVEEYENETGHKPLSDFEFGQIILRS